MSVVTLEEFVEVCSYDERDLADIKLLNEEQHIDMAKMRNYARHGVHPQVRGEVWLYLLGVLSADKSQEMTMVRNKFHEYESMNKRAPFTEKQIRAEVHRFYRQRLGVVRRPVRRQHALVRGQSPWENTQLDQTAADITAEKGQYPRTLPSTQYGLMTMRTNMSSEDPETVHEERRFAHTVENVLCAYLNRHAQPGMQPRDALGDGRGEHEALQASVESRMPRAYEWMPHAKPKPGAEWMEFHPSLVYLCAPFAHCVRAEAGMYFAFERLMNMIERYNVTNPLPQRVATFLSLFRTTLPELHAYFEAEEVDLVAFATSWLQHLLARELQIDNLMRLWDTYFAVPDLLNLHLYVCVAILTNCKDALEEFDRSETTSMLFSLPPLDMDRIISDAMNIRLIHENEQVMD